MDTFTEDPITEMVDGKLCWRFADGTTHPVIRGAAVDEDSDDEDDGDDADDGDEDDGDDAGDGDDADDEDGDDDGDDSDDGNEDEDDDTDAWVDLVSEAVVAKVGAEIDRRINKALRKVRRDEDDEDDGGRRGGRRRTRRQDPEFSVREARLAGMELIRDEMPRMSTAEREAARTMLTAQIASESGSGDDEETVGERAAETVLSTMKALRGPKKRPVKKAPPQRKKQGSARTRDAGSKMNAGAARAARFNPSTEE
jgi:hypothetical protein